MKYPEQIGSYKILSKIGEGGMGVVYLAEHTKLDRRVAIKILDSSLSTKAQFRQRFLNEANVLAKLNHPNIVSIYDLLEYEEQYCIVMEYVDGLSLSERIEKHGALDSEESTEIILKVLSGLAYAHDRSVVHRDIKPSNIIIGESGTVKVLDFGIAKMLDSNSNLTRTGTKMGSISYMSPEQVLGKELDLKTDIYSLGVTLFEMLSGKLPFDVNTESDFITQRRIVSDNLPSVREGNPGISERLDKAIEISTRKNPFERFSDCAEFSSFITGDASIPERTKVTSAPAPIDRSRTIIDERSKDYTMILPVEGIHATPVKKSSSIVATLIATALVVVGVTAYLLFRTDTDSVQKNDTVSSIPKVTKSITSEEVSAFVNKWCSYQSMKSIPQYLNCYSSDFVGIKRTNSGKEFTYDYSGWAADRVKMYESAEGLNISASNVKIVSGPDASGVTTIEFDQFYYSKKYNDKGKKIMKLKRSGESDIKITYEELLYSQQIFD